MSAETTGDEALVAAICAAIEPYRWSGFTPELLARFVLAAADRHGLETLLLEVPGAIPGRWNALDPVPNDDVRVDRLVRILAVHRWTEFRLETLCRLLLAAVRS